MKRRRSGLALTLRVFLHGHAVVWHERWSYMRRGPVGSAVGDGIEAFLCAVSFYLGCVVATVGRHPGIMDNLIASRVDTRLPNPPGPLEAHQVFGAGFALCGLLGFVGVMEWPSPDTDGKMPTGTPPRLLTNLLFLRLCGSIAAVMFWLYNLCLTLPMYPHSIVGAVSLLGFGTHFALCVRAGKRYSQDQRAIRRASRRTEETIALPAAL